MKKTFGSLLSDHSKLARYSYLFMFAIMFVFASYNTRTEVLAVEVNIMGDVAPSTSIASPCISLSNNLWVGSRDTTTGGEVSLLQGFLADTGYYNGEPTGYFGQITMASVKTFQGANGVLSSGYVGPITRALIEKISCGGTTSTPVPVPTTLIPTTSACPVGYTCTPPTIPPTTTDPNGTYHIPGDISSCGTLGKPGRYTLTDDLTANGTCFSIIADGVILDGADHSIKGNGTGYGVSVANSKDVTVTNLSVGYFFTGVLFQSVSNSIIDSVESRFNTENGFSIYSSSKNNIYLNIIEGSGLHGMDVAFGSNNNSIHKNKVSKTKKYGAIKIHSGIGNVIESNTFTGSYNAPGISLSDGSKDNQVINNTSTYNTDGIAIAHSYGNTVTGNTFNNNTGIDISCQESSSIGKNTFSNNTHKKNTCGDVTTTQYLLDIISAESKGTLTPTEAPFIKNVVGRKVIDNSTPTPDDGFNVEAYIYNTVDPNPKVSILQDINAVFDYRSKSWSGKFDPIATVGRYKLEVVLYCSQESLCGDKYRAVQAYETFYFEVRSDTTTQPSISIIYPKYYDSYNVGGKINVVWESKNISSYASLDVIRLRNAESGVEYVLASSVLNDGREVLVIPSSVPIGTYTLEIKTYLKGATDPIIASSGKFSIVGTTQPSITVISPNGGETYKVGDSVPIQWKALNFPANSMVYVELRPSGSGLSPVTKIGVFSPRDGYSYWKVPSTIIPGQYIIEIYKADLNGNIDPNESVKDVSDSYFKIISEITTQPSISFINPTSAKAGTDTTVIIYGSGFFGDQSVEFSGRSDDGGGYDTSFKPSYISPEGTKMVFTIPSSIKSGSYLIATGEFGKSMSNHVDFKLTANTPTLTLQSVNWTKDISSGDIYYNPRANFGAEDKATFHDNLTASKWCQAVPDKGYGSGTSYINWANPQDGSRFRWTGTEWVEKIGGDYARYYQCSYKG